MGTQILILLWFKTVSLGAGPHKALENFACNPKMSTKTITILTFLKVWPETKIAPNFTVVKS